MKTHADTQAQTTRRAAADRDPAHRAAAPASGDPRAAAQLQRIQAAFGAPVQRAAEKKEPVQRRFDAAQRVEAEEPLQGRCEDVQRPEEEAQWQAETTAGGLPAELAAGVDVMGAQAVADGMAVHAMHRARLPSPAQAPIQAQWTDMSVTAANRAEMEARMGIPRKLVDESEAAGQSLLDGALFLVPPAATLKTELAAGQPLRAAPSDRLTIGETHHGADTWPHATAPWPYIPKMRERFKTFEKPGEAGVKTADVLEAPLGGDERAQTGDLALEGQAEYAVSALSIVQQLLKGYDSVFEAEGPGSAQLKNNYVGMLMPRLLELRIVLMRYRTIGIKLSQNAVKSPKEQALLDLALHIDSHEGRPLVDSVSKGGDTGEVTQLGGFWQRHFGKKIQTMQDLIEGVANRIIALEGFANMKPMQDLNQGRERGLTTWATRTGQAITDASTRDIRELEMVRRINAAAVPFMVQVGAAHIPGLIAKGVAGATYVTEADFVTKTTKANKPDVYETRMESDALKHRSLNLWG